MTKNYNKYEKARKSSIKNFKIKEFWVNFHFLVKDLKKSNRTAIRLKEIVLFKKKQAFKIYSNDNLIFRFLEQQLRLLELNNYETVLSILKIKTNNMVYKLR